MGLQIYRIGKDVELITSRYFILLIPADSLQWRKVLVCGMVRLVIRIKVTIFWFILIFNLKNLTSTIDWPMWPIKCNCTLVWKSATPVESSQLFYQTQKWVTRWLTRAWVWASFIQSLVTQWASNRGNGGECLGRDHRGKGEALKWNQRDQNR